MPKTVTIGSYTIRTHLVGGCAYSEHRDETDVFSFDGGCLHSVSGDHCATLKAAIESEPEFSSLSTVTSGGS